MADTYADDHDYTGSQFGAIRIARKSLDEWWGIDASPDLDRNLARVLREAADSIDPDTTSGHASQGDPDSGSSTEGDDDDPFHDVD